MQFSNCIAVKGFSRTAIYDVQRARFILVDNYFADLLDNYQNKIPIDKMDLEWKHYIDKLVEDEWGLLTSKAIADLFPPLNLQWKHYAEITNAVIDLNGDLGEIDYFFSYVLPQFEALTCKAFQVNFLSQINFENLLNFLKRFDDTQVHFLIVHLPYVLLTQEETEALYNIQPRLNFLCYYACPRSLNSKIKNEKSYYSGKDISARKNNLISTDYFVINLSFFTESQRFNTYYNKKLSIDVNGCIKNVPEQIHDYGNIKSRRLDEVIESHKFRSFWNVHKGLIDVCKDCEYRHMCVDSCNLIKRNDGTWFRSKECNYNPYISKWSNEDEYKSLSECGITVNENGFLIDDLKINEINNELWK